MISGRGYCLSLTSLSIFQSDCFIILLNQCALPYTGKAQFQLNYAPSHWKLYQKGSMPEIFWQTRWPPLKRTCSRQPLTTSSPQPKGLPSLHVILSHLPESQYKVPVPYLCPFTKVPQQQGKHAFYCPFLYTYLPSPWGIPFFHYPMYSSRLWYFMYLCYFDSSLALLIVASISLLLPKIQMLSCICFQSLTVSTLTQTFLDFKDPKNLNSPCSLNLPDSKWPMYALLFGKATTPFPYRYPLLTWPAQTKLSKRWKMCIFLGEKRLRVAFQQDFWQRESNFCQIKCIQLVLQFSVSTFGVLCTICQKNLSNSLVSAVFIQLIFGLQQILVVATPINNLQVYSYRIVILLPNNIQGRSQRIQQMRKAKTKTQNKYYDQETSIVRKKGVRVYEQLLDGTGLLV